MNRQQKEAAINDFQGMLEKSHAAFLVNYKGTSVADLQSLRNGLRSDDALLKVSKARIMKIAVSKVEGSDEFKETFKDQVGIVFALGEVPAVAKKLVDFSKNHDSFAVVNGFFEKSLVNKDQVIALASLPSREVLLAMLAGGLQAPISGFAHVLRMMLMRFLFVLKQVAETKS